MKITRKPQSSMTQDKLYVVYAPKIAELVGAGFGVLAHFISLSKDKAKVKVLGTNVIRDVNLDAKTNFFYEVFESVKVEVRVADLNEWPSITQRMQDEGWLGKQIELSTNQIFINNDAESPGFELHIARIAGETTRPGTDRPYINTFKVSSLVPVVQPEWRVPRSVAMGVAVELPLPPKPVLEQHKALMEKSVELFEKIKRNMSNNNTGYIKFNADFSQKSEQFNRPCHAAMKERAGFAVDYIATLGLNTTSKQWVKGVASKEAQLLWITYLTSYSPYAEAFVSKDPEFILENGYVLDAAAPANLVVSACYATRQTWERPARLEGFLALYKAGVQLDLAFIIGCQTSVYKDGLMAMGEAGDSHSHLNNSRLKEKSVVNFIKGEHRASKSYHEYSKSTFECSSDELWGELSNGASAFYTSVSKFGHGGGFKGKPMDDVVNDIADFAEDFMEKHFKKS